MESRIKILREKRGIIQEILAAELGITQQMLSKYEKDVTIIKVDILKKLAEYFNVTTDYLLKDQIETIDNVDSYSSKNIDMQMLNKELSENGFQNIQYEAEKKKHISYWLLIIAPFIMILVIFIFYYGFYC